jgi:hypothetical protein
VLWGSKALIWETKTLSLSSIRRGLPSGFFQSQSRKRCFHRPSSPLIDLTKRIKAFSSESLPLGWHSLKTRSSPHPKH